MINKDLLKYTISDLVIKSIYDNNELYLDEVKKRLYFCGFSPNVGDEIIKSELKLVGCKKNELLTSKVIINNTFKVSDIDTKRMMLIELLCLIDEAVMIAKFYKNKYSDDVLSEIEFISKEDMQNILFKEFYNRLEKCFRKANNLELKYKGFVYEEQIGKLYENEMTIILKSRWSEVLEVDFNPYSGDM